MLIQTTRTKGFPRVDLDAAAADPALRDALELLGYMDDEGNVVRTGPSLMERLGYAIIGRNPLGVAAAIHLGAAVDAECYMDVTHGYGNLTALAAAILSDSADGEILLTPLLLSLGGRIDEVDSRAMTVTDYARFEPLFDWLVAQGAPPSTRSFPRARPGGSYGIGGQADPAAGFPVAMPIPESDLIATVRPGLLEAMDELGMGTPDGPHVCFYPQQEIVHALRDRDEPAIRRLIELGALEGPGGFLQSTKTGTVEGLNVWTLAAVLDCEAGSPALVSVLLESGQVPSPDGRGRSMLHVAGHPAVCRFLLSAGIDPEARDEDGHTPVDVLPADARAALEQVVLGQSRALRQETAMPQARRL